MSRRGRRSGRVELERIEDVREGETKEDNNGEQTDQFDTAIDRKCSCAEKKSISKLQRRASVFSKDYSMQQRESRKTSLDMRGVPAKICHSDEPVRKPPSGYDRENNQKVANSYVLAPPKKFDVENIKKIVLEELNKVQEICQHNHNGMCLHLSEEIKRRVKTLGLRRYRFIVMVTIGENKQQGFNMATKFFWNEQFDGFVSESYEVDGCFIVAVVYGIYCM